MLFLMKEQNLLLMIQVKRDQFVYIIIIGKYLRQNIKSQQYYSSMKEHQKRFIQSENYFELSEIVRLCYEEEPCIPVMPELEEIDQWVNAAQSKPLLISSEPSGGKKTLIWEYIKQKKSNIIISEFASVDPSYASILYRIMIKLRNILEINQQVELNEEKLRRYFHYWLETASNFIDRKYIGYTENQKKKIIIIIEGVDYILDSKNNPVLPFFWLPKTIPNNIKLILTSNNNSPIFSLLHANTSHHINHHLKDNEVEDTKSNIIKKSLFDLHKDASFSLPELRLMLKITEANNMYNIGEDIKSFQRFLENYIEFVSTQNLSTEMVLKLLGSLAISKKGLCREVLKKIGKTQQSNVNLFLVHFDPIVVKFEEFFLICDKTCREAIKSLIEKNENKINFNVKILHHTISKTMKKLSMSIHNLEQRIHHLLCCKNYTELKEVLSRIEHFLILYTPLSKQILCMCWFHLELQFQYDPVFEYNKSIERFLNNYYPTPEDIFKIIFQLSLFFKEYSEFQNSKTPKFRHPPIRGEAEQLKEISLYDELVNLGMYQKCKEKKKEGKNSIQKNEQEEIKEVEKLNVKIKFHQEKFQNFYLELMKPFINEYCLFNKKTKKAKEQVLEEDSDDSDRQFDENKISLQKIKEKLLLKNYSEYGEEEYHRLGEKKTYYYYKQWIWMQFPWISQSINHNFSEQIKYCIKSPTEFMSIAEEFQLIQSAVKIAKIARNNKKQIYQEKEIELTPVTSSYIFKKTQSFIEFKKENEKKDLSKSKFTVKKKGKILIRDNSIIDSMQNKMPNGKSLPKQRQNSNTFITNISLNQSYVENNLNTSRDKRLPLIDSKVSQNRKWLSNKKNQGERSEMFITSKINELKNQNKKLLKSIQDLKKNQQNLQNSTLEPKIQSMKEKLSDLKKENQKVEKLYLAEELLKGKLETIIKLCDINKSHGSESADLSNFLQSLKLMTKMEEEAIEKLAKKGKAMLQQNKEVLKKLRGDKERLKKKEKEGKSVGQILRQEKTLKYINLPKTQEKKILKKKKAPLQKDEERKKVILEKEVENIKKIQEQLEAFGIFFGKQEENKDVLNSIEYLFNKNKQLNWKLKELQEENKEKEKVLQSLSEKVGEISHRNEYNIEKDIREKVLYLQERKKEQVKRQNLMKKCMSLLEIN